MPTANEVYEAHEAGEPIEVSKHEATIELRKHGFTFAEFAAECGDKATYDAWEVLEWLGY